MRYIWNKLGNIDWWYQIGNECEWKSLSCNNVSLKPVTDNSNISEQIYDQMGYKINSNDCATNNQYGWNEYNYEYQVETNEGCFLLIYDKQAVYFIDRSITKKEKNNLKGGLTHNSKIKDKPVAICDAIIFLKCDRYRREDKPGKHFFNVFFSVAGRRELSTKVMEEAALNSSQCSTAFNPEIVRPFQEKRCSIFFCTEIYRVSQNSREIIIPSRPGWYYDECYGWVFLNKDRYEKLSESDLPPLLCKRRVHEPERSVNEVYSDLMAIIEPDLHRRVLWAVRLISSILMPLERIGVYVRTIVAAIVEKTSEMSVAAAILKTGDFEKYDTVSLNSTTAEIDKEIGGARDGVATIIGPLTAKEAKLNAKNVNHIRDAAIGATGADKKVRSVISLVGRFIPEDLSSDFIFSVKFLNKFDSIDERNLRSHVLEFEAIYIHYIEDHFSEVSGLVRETVENYKAKPNSDIVRDKEGLYIAFIVVQKVLSECFDIKLFNDEESII